jgi:hypothetical protein
LPQETKDILRELHQEETSTRTGPLYRDGKRTTNIVIEPEKFDQARLAADPDLPLKEWFVERVRALNIRWLEGRMASDHPTLLDVWRRLLERLRVIYRRFWKGVDEDVFMEDFRRWIATGGRPQGGRAPAMAQQSTFDLGGTAVGIELPAAIRNLQPRWQDKILAFGASLDKALYYAGGANSEVRADIVRSLADQTGLSPGQIATLARELRGRIAPLTQGAAAGATVRVPAQMAERVEKLTGVQFAQEQAKIDPAVIASYVSGNGTLATEYFNT